MICNEKKSKDPEMVVALSFQVIAIALHKSSYPFSSRPRGVNQVQHTLQAVREEVKGESVHVYSCWGENQNNI